MEIGVNSTWNGVSPWEQPLELSSEHGKRNPIKMLGGATLEMSPCRLRGAIKCVVDVFKTYIVIEYVSPL